MIIKKNQQQQDAVPQEEPQTEISVEPESIDLFNLDNIDFTQRNERRRGDRRRGFRRVDERNLISRAREEAQALKDAAVKEGYQQGLQQAREEINRFRGSLVKYMNATQEVFDKVVPYVLEMSIDIAKKIIKQEVSENPQILMRNIQEILKGLQRDEPKITIKANPMQVAMIKQAIPDIASNLGIDAKIHVIPDETISEGGTIVTTNNGVIDATVDTQVTIVIEALKG